MVYMTRASPVYSADITLAPCLKATVVGEPYK